MMRTVIPRALGSLKQFVALPPPVLMLGAVLAVLPAAFAVMQAWSLAVREQGAVLQAYTMDMQDRVDRTAEQASRAIDSLRSSPQAPCSTAQMLRMSQLDLRSSYLQAIAYLQAGKVMCSSYGLGDAGMDPGPPGPPSAQGVRLYLHMRFSFGPDRELIGVERDHYLVVVDRELPVSTNTATPDAALVLYATPGGRILAAHGRSSPTWFTRLRPGGQRVFFADGYLIAQRQSLRREVLAVAALPRTHVYAAAGALALRLVPLGLLAGVALAFGLFHVVRQQSSLPSAIRTAIRRREFRLVYQPVVDLRSGRTVGAEALLRWHRADGRVIRPDLFIPVAEDTGLISDLTQYVIDGVERECATLLRRHPQLHLAINVAPADLVSARLPARIEAIQRFPARSLIIEATERGFLDAAASRSVIQELRSAGVRVAIDDFGTGYSSLSYLGKLTVDYLKIDKSFVEAIGTDAPTREVALHIIRLAHSLGLTMIAEGVETPEQADFLRGRGVQFAQGWLFGKPMSWREFAARIDAEAIPADAA